ncbi:MAG: hypothetical protein [Bacteriophage sp.]|jgi:hypothetical protein|uniref:Uncharacterized protein n=1 Tax=Streptococcus vestibularis TaxID=1343 RepID=A0AAW7QJA1_STRVE|nr:hypothetical protein [Streptococcus vestibularis]UVY43968.1 MAG: hypothetical protein [Bacteriophage sp.]WMU95439.1 hypothetical protein [Streptococcus phage SVep1]DAS10113.1 MAG TPA: hypothetical protein [Caudoviricetes sp.]MDN5269526.1 hypothetical protein [Streptococcus vestibularis]UWG05243.1 MAG: hypothetical protein [Bacteriophage sp.]
MKLIAKQALSAYGWTLEEYYETDFYDLMNILGAKEVKDRPVDPMSLLK